MWELIDRNWNSLLEQLRVKEEKVLKEKWRLDSYWRIKLTQILDNVFSVEWKSGNISYFIDSNWDTTINIVWLSEPSNVYYRRASILSWFWDIKWDDWIYRLFRITDVDIKVDNWNWEFETLQTNQMLSEFWVTRILEMLNSKKIIIVPRIWTEEINKYSEEYYNAWKDIDFYSWTFLIRSLLIPSKEWTLWKYEEDVYLSMIEKWNIRVKDFIRFYEQWQIIWEQEMWKDVYDKLLPKVANLLLWQIWDRRFDMVWDPITKVELDWYLKEWYITEEYYLQCIELMVELWKVDKKILDELKQQIKPELDWLMREVK